MLARLWSWLAEAKVTRSDCVVGIGGGAATDLAGFAAATWLRGVPSSRCRRRCSAWSTRRSAARPRSTSRRARTWSARSTRPPGCSPTWRPWRPCRGQDYVAGLAEVVKAGFIADGEILRLVAADPRGRGPARRPAHPRARRAVDRGQGPRGGGRPARVRACGRCSTTGTRSATPSRSLSGTPSGTATRSRSAWCSRPRWPGCPAT